MSCQNCLAKKCRLSEGNHGQSPPFFTTSDHNWSKGTICVGKDGIAELGARSRVMRWNSADGHKPFPRCDIVRAPMLGYGHGWLLELITFENLAADQLRLMGFDNRLIIDCFANVVNILIWLFSTNDRFRSEKYESNYLENPFPEMKGVNLLSKTHCNVKGNLKLKTVLQELVHVDRFS